ncbi:MAG: response regulator transcription factor [Flavobacteriales bacterium]|nr:response regulator transcription factor [Flavobacteriales bacterium]
MTYPEKILIVEDDFLIAEHLKSILEKEGFLHISARHNYAEALEFCQKERPDLALLDINLEEEKTGTDLAQKLSLLEIPYIYITAQSDQNTVSQIMETRPVAYILKPFRVPEVTTMVKLALQNISTSSISVFDGKTEYRLKYHDILFLKSEGNYVEIHQKDKVHTVRNTLSGICAQLPESLFIQTHRSFVVNKNHVERVGAGEVVLGGQVVPLSRPVEDLLKK